ncbi:MAG: TonB-dependent receptor [Sideroxydans sp.]|nr:TonB-dependent receptor [Sideroxydans sp.]
MKSPRSLHLACLVACALSPSFDALAEEDASFELGTITVTAPRAEVGEMGEHQVASVLTRKEMKKHNRDNVGDALNLLSGITLTNSGMRNEKMIYVRGFDARQAPLFIDGIPVYVPYDGYVDLNRFTTADLGAIQVSKGFSSVAYGPNTLGGAINLVSRKPRSSFEGDVAAGFASGNERQAQANFGSNQQTWYMQTGISYLQSDNYPLSKSFTPTATEDGGARENSYRKDSKLSLKLGLTPGNGDEYALSYYKQDGEKGQPPSTGAFARYWRWPFWNKKSLYFVSRTGLGTDEVLKTRIYWDKFDNGLDIYADATYPAITNPAANSSTYDDTSRGASFELSTYRLAEQELKLVAQYKEDEHIARDGVSTVTESFKDTLLSAAVEDDIFLTEQAHLSLGLSHHTLRPETVYKVGSPFTLPDAKSATSGQIGLFYDVSPEARIYATLAQKTRLPTLKDRYSARFSTYIENTGLRPESSLNYEVGYQGAIWRDTRAEAAIYLSNISDKIQTAYQPGSTTCSTSSLCQMQNIGEVRASGIELGLNSALSSMLEVGSNYTLTVMSNISDPATRITSVPRHKAIAHATYKIGEAFETTTFIEYNSSRWASNTVELSGYTTLNLKAVYHFTRAFSAEAGINNATDRNYSLADGYPNAGRTLFANASVQF